MIGPWPLEVNWAMPSSAKEEIWAWKGIHGDKIYYKNLGLIPLATLLGHMERK